jgi:hypothetical protein
LVEFSGFIWPLKTRQVRGFPRTDRDGPVGQFFFDSPAMAAA